MSLIGTMTHAGDLTVNGEGTTGCVIEIGRGQLKDADRIPMYETCVILTLAEYEKLKEANQ